MNWIWSLDVEKKKKNSLSFSLSLFLFLSLSRSLSLCVCVCVRTAAKRAFNVCLVKLKFLLLFSNKQTNKQKQDSKVVHDIQRPHHVGRLRG